MRRPTVCRALNRLLRHFCCKLPPVHIPGRLAGLFAKWVACPLGRDFGLCGEIQQPVTPLKCKIIWGCLMSAPTKSGCMPRCFDDVIKASSKSKTFKGRIQFQTVDLVKLSKEMLDGLYKHWLMRHQGNHCCNLPPPPKKEKTIWSRAFMKLENAFLRAQFVVVILAE